MGLKNRKNRNSKTLFDSNKIFRIHGFHPFTGIVMVFGELFLFVCARVPNYEGLYTKMMIFQNFVWVKNHLRVKIFRIFNSQKSPTIMLKWWVKFVFSTDFTKNTKDAKSANQLQRIRNFSMNSCFLVAQSVKPCPV